MYLFHKTRRQLIIELPGTPHVHTFMIRTSHKHHDSSLMLVKLLSSRVLTKASSLCVLRVLRTHGLLPLGLHDMAMTTTVTQIMYASPAWWWYTNDKERHKSESLLNQMKCGDIILASAYVLQAWPRLLMQAYFWAICSELRHILHGILLHGRSITT